MDRRNSSISSHLVRTSRRGALLRAAVCRLAGPLAAVAFVVSPSAAPLAEAQSLGDEAAAEVEPRSWLGVSMRSVADADGGGDLLPGVEVVGVVRGSPADDAGLRAGDLILTVDGVPLSSPGALSELVASADRGNWVELFVRRGEREFEVTAQLGKRPGPGEDVSFKQAWAGLVPVDVPEQLREFWGGDERRGVLVGSVTPTGPAEVGGVLPGDLVLEMDGEPVASAMQLLYEISRSGVENEIVLLISRQGTQIEVELELGQRPSPEELRELGEVFRPERGERRR